MIKMNSRGFAHHVAIMAVVVVVAIGGIGSYIYLRQSDAAVAKCGSGYKLSYSSQINPLGFYRNGHEVARLVIYKNKSARKICATLVSKNESDGVAKRMKISVTLEKKVASTSPQQYPWQIIKGHADVDSGTFKHFAGPVYVSYKGYAAKDQSKATVKKGFRISVYGEMKYKAHTYYQNTVL